MSPAAVTMTAPMRPSSRAVFSPLVQRCTTGTTRGAVTAVPGTEWLHTSDGWCTTRQGRSPDAGVRAGRAPIHTQIRTHARNLAVEVDDDDRHQPARRERAVGNRAGRDAERDERR